MSTRRPAEEIERFIENVPLETRGQRDREVLDDALRALQESKKHTQRQPNIWKAIMKSRAARLAAAAAIVLAVLAGIGTFDKTIAWADVLRALEEVDSIHLVQVSTWPDGTESVQRRWLRKPDCLRDEEPNKVVIDNGRERLTLDRENEEAQLEDSWTQYRPVSQDYLFEQIGLFRGKKIEGLSVKKLEDQGDAKTSVFHLEMTSPPPLPQGAGGEGRAWVNNSTMLPTRLTMRLVGRPQKGAPLSTDVTVDYSLIPDEVFDPVVPDGYKVLHIRGGAISGQVVDEDGSPVAGATVYCTDKWLRFLRQVETDPTGEFVFKLPPSNVRWVGLPIFLRAVPRNDPLHVAWTIIESFGDKRDRGVDISGQVKYIDADKGGMLKSIGGITLEMEPAGILTGYVTDLQGDPISGAEVLVQGWAEVRKPGMFTHADFGFIGDPLGGAGPRGELTARTNKQGRYEVTNVPRFSTRNWYKVVAQAPGFSTNEQRRGTSWKSDVEQMDIKLYNAGITVSGTLVDNYGQVLGMREIRAHVGDDAGGRIFCSTTTDEEGRFVLKDCPVSAKLQIRAILAQNTWQHLGKEKRLSYTYYPNVIVPIGYQEGTTDYEVKLVAEKPEFTIELEVKNSAGEAVVNYPVKLDGASRPRSRPGIEWEKQVRFRHRTDRQGTCTFTEMPNFNGLHLKVGREPSIWWNDDLSKEEAEKARERNARYQPTIVPIEVIPGQKHYKIEVTLLTDEEHKTRK